jgi:hypothetical protein
MSPSHTAASPITKSLPSTGKSHAMLEPWKGARTKESLALVSLDPLPPDCATSGPGSPGPWATGRLSTRRNRSPASARDLDPRGPDSPAAHTPELLERLALPQFAEL